MQIRRSAITDLRSKGALQPVRSWLRTILYELPWGHFGDDVNPRIVIGKFLTFPWDMSSGTDGHDCDSAKLSPRLLIVNTDFLRIVRRSRKSMNFMNIWWSSWQFINALEFFSIKKILISVLRSKRTIVETVLPTYSAMQIVFLSVVLFFIKIFIIEIVVTIYSVFYSAWSLLDISLDGNETERKRFHACENLIRSWVYVPRTKLREEILRMV